VRLADPPPLLAGREDLLAELDTRLTGGDNSGPRTVALCGLGGTGKTSVALAYAHRHLAEVAVAWQFAAEDPTLVAAGFAELAAQLGARDDADTRDPVASVHGTLAAFRAKWLLIFDNAPDRPSVETFLPPAGTGQVLITSQSAVWPPGQAMEVPVLGTEAAAEFLVNRTGDPDSQTAATLAEQLGGLPLALEQAAAYIQAAQVTGTTLAGYLSLFRVRQADLLARGQAAGHTANVAATLGLALSRLGKEAPAAAGLLRLLAFLAPEPVPLGLLLADPRVADELAPAVAAMVGPLLRDPAAAGDAIIALGRYSLVTPAGKLGGLPLILVHRLVQAITRAEVPADVVGQWERTAAALVEAAVPADTEVPTAWQVCAVLLPHARAVLDLTSGGMRRIALHLGYSGSWPAARDLFRLIADAHTEDDAYGAEHPHTLFVRGNLAVWTGEAGDAAGARDQYAALLPIFERILGPEHPDTLTVRGGLAVWTGMAGDPAAARDLFAELLPVREGVLGPEHPDTLNARAGLAAWTGMAGDAAGARDQWAALLPVIERVSGPERPDTPEHPDTLTARASLAVWTGEAGDAAGARDQHAALLPIFERIFGPEHPDTLTVRADLATWTGKARDEISVISDPGPAVK
jgi:Tetratricopeptide repeat